ncbi:MAG: patatin-like phospholipase family protein, partial [Kangiellaceae bacterium]|nr:patatin-like phospholipase family protein [Kangiellaceae bacterium]
MTTEKNSIESAFTQDFEHVGKKEKEWIKKRREFLGQNPHAPVVGLSLSGGGIRSATFNLGILQALSRKKLLPQVDILSTVSGGGYIGSCFNWIRNHVSPERYREFTDTPIDKSTGNGKTETVLDWLRGHGNYLIAGRGFSFWQLIASIIAGTLLNLIVLIPLFLWAITLMSADWFTALEWPQALHFSESSPMQQHDGFLLFLILGKVCFLLYLVTVIAFAFTGVFPAFRRLTQRYFFRRNMGRLLGLGISLIVIGVLPLFAGIDNWVDANFAQENAAEISQHLAYIVPLITGVFALFKSKPGKSTKNSSGVLAAVGLSLLMYGFFILLYHIVNHTQFVDSATFLTWSIISLILAFTSDVNVISMHSYYRGRLALAYMPVVKNESGENVSSDNAMDFELRMMSPKYGGPLPVINTTINTTSSKKQKLRSREGD